MKVEVSEFIDVLLQYYPGNEEQLKTEDPVDLIVMKILEDQTNSQKFVKSAFEKLKSQFKSWKEVLEAPDWKVAMAIKDVGYSNRKTRYIKEFLKFVAEHNWDLSWMKNLPIEEALKVIQGIKGIPTVEARYILLFGFDMPVFPTDAHIKRVIRRIGILGNNATEEQISKYFESMRNIPYKKLYLALRTHANNICAARKPKCLMCPLAQYCHSVSPSVEYIQARSI